MGSAPEPGNGDASLSLAVELWTWAWSSHRDETARPSRPRRPWTLTLALTLCVCMCVPLAGAFGVVADLDAVSSSAKSSLTPETTRSSPYLTHPIFNSHHSETQMLRCDGHKHRAR